MSLEKKQTLIATMREKLAQNNIKPGVLVKQLPRTSNNKAYLGIKHKATLNIFFYVYLVETGDILLYLGLEAIDVNNSFSEKPSNLACKFLWKDTIIYMLVKQHSFLRVFKRNFSLVQKGGNDCQA